MSREARREIFRLPDLLNVTLWDDEEDDDDNDDGVRIPKTNQQTNKPLSSSLAILLSFKLNYTQHFYIPWVSKVKETNLQLTRLFFCLSHDRVWRRRVTFITNHFLPLQTELMFFDLFPLLDSLTSVIHPGFSRQASL